MGGSGGCAERILFRPAGFETLATFGWKEKRGHDWPCADKPRIDKIDNAITFCHQLRSGKSKFSKRRAGFEEDEWMNG
jgi:hypothetical protein